MRIIRIQCDRYFTVVSSTRSPALDSRKGIGNVVTIMSDQLDRDIQPDSRFVVMGDMKVH